MINHRQLEVVDLYGLHSIDRSDFSPTTYRVEAGNLVLASTIISGTHAGENLVTKESLISSGLRLGQKSAHSVSPALLSSLLSSSADHVPDDLVFGEVR